SDPQISCDEIQSLSVPIGFLPQIETHQRETETCESAQYVQKSSICNYACSRLLKRSVAKQERFGDLLRVVVDLFTILALTCEEFFQIPKRRLHSSPHYAQQFTIRLARIASYCSPQFIAAFDH